MAPSRFSAGLLFRKTLVLEGSVCDVDDQERRAADRPEPGHRRAPRGNRSRRALRRESAHHGRERRRQGNRRAEHSLPEPARRHGVRAGQLRRPAGNAARIGAVRPRPGQLHRRLPRQAGQARSRAQRHGVPRRNRRDDAAHAGAAAALPRNRRAAEGRRRRRRPDASTCA